MTVGNKLGHKHGHIMSPLFSLDSLLNLHDMSMLRHAGRHIWSSWAPSLSAALQQGGFEQLRHMGTERRPGLSGAWKQSEWQCIRGRSGEPPTGQDPWQSANGHLHAPLPPAHSCS
jgi:hypothetical protein